jgi:hypothetical protein
VASVLGSAVFNMTASTAGLTVGMNRALAMVTAGLGRISETALASNNRIVQGLGRVGVAATMASKGVELLTTSLAGLTGPVNLASDYIDAAHRLEQTFGSSAKDLTKTINEQSAAFGHARISLTTYADTVGRELQTLGVSEKASAEMAERVIQATSRLAAARRISPEQAFAQIRSGQGLFSHEQVRAVALEKGLLSNRNQELTKGNELLAQYYLSVREVADSTEGLSEASQTWSGQLELLKNSFVELSIEIGTDIAPVFKDILMDIQGWVGGLRQFYELLRDSSRVFANWIVTRDIDESIAAMQRLKEPGEQKGALAGIDARNAARAERNRREAILGQVMGRGGGGGGGAFQGSLAGFHAKVQESAWQQRQLATLEKQAQHGEQALTKLDQINAAIRTRNKDNAPF